MAAVAHRLEPTIRNTKQRIAIRKAFRRAGRPLAPQEVLALAKTAHSALSLATVYRALRALEDEGFIRSVTIPGQTARYELADLEHHHHFCCNTCDRVFDVVGCPGALEELAPRGFAVDSHDVVLYGACAACNAC